MSGSGDLEQSLRADIEGYINGRLGGLQKEVAQLQSQLNEAFTRLSERFKSESQSDASIAVTISEHLRDARNHGIEAAASESMRARSSSDIAIIKAAIDELDNQRSQSDILNTLVNRAASFAPRVAFFVIKNDRATGWRARGLEGTVGDNTVREISLPLTSDTLLSEVVRTRSTWSGSAGSHADDREIFGKFSDEPPQRIIAIPLLAREKAVAVLYADSAEMDSDAINLEALETLVRVAGMAVELLATKRPTPTPANAAVNAAQPQPTPPSAATQASSYEMQPAPPAASISDTSRSDAAPPAASMSDSSMSGAAMFDRSDASTSDSAAAAPTGAVEETAPAPSFETVSEPSASYDAAPAYEQSAPPATSGAWTDEAARTPPVSFEAAPASPPPPVEPSTGSATPSRPARRYGADAAPLPIEVSEDQQAIHKQARSFARLLVYEIKMYNESKVAEGRARGDLYNRLHDDIDKARRAYDNDKRVTPEVAERYDYFHHELVNQLAEGDASKLGDGYPGATVSA